MTPPQRQRCSSVAPSWAGTPAEAARGADAVITCLPSPAAVAVVLEGDDGVLSTLRRGGTWIDMSTNDKHELLRLAAIAQANGVETLEAPVTGGVHLAASGEITIIVGGDPEVADAHMALLRAMGRRIFHVGPLGSASDLKVITNMLAFVHLVACGEALMLAKQSGLDLAQAYEVIRASSGTSFVHETEGQVILNGSYDIGFTIDLALKDLGLALALGERDRCPARARRARRAGVPACAGAVRRRSLVADGREASRGRGRGRPASTRLSGHARARLTRKAVRSARYGREPAWRDQSKSPAAATRTPSGIFARTDPRKRIRSSRAPRESPLARQRRAARPRT